MFRYKRAIGISVLCMSLFLGACGSKTVEEPPPKPVKTMAMRMADEDMAEKGYTLTEDFSGENVESFDLADGSRLIRLFSAPLENEELTIEGQEGGDFTSKGNYTQITFPGSISSETPLLIVTRGQTLKLMPAGDGRHPGERVEVTNAFGQLRQSVRYADFFGPGLDCLFTPTSFGVSTEVILTDKPESGTLRLRAAVQGLIPDTGSPDYILFKTALENGAVKSILYTPMAVDKTGKWSYANAVNLTEKDAAADIYTVEYTLDEDFFGSEDTVYPVVCNQSLYNYISKQPDTSAYSETGDIAGHYLSPYVLLGDATLKGEGWTYIRYETLEKLDIPADKVVSAHYVFHNLLDLPSQVTVGAYAVTADWCSINTRWFNRPPNDDKPVSLIPVEKQGDYELDITSLLQEMLKNKGKEDAKYSVQNSFMIRCNTEGSNLLLASGDNGLYSPCLEIVVKE